MWLSACCYVLFVIYKSSSSPISPISRSSSWLGSTTAAGLGVVVAAAAGVAVGGVASDFCEAEGVTDGLVDAAAGFGVVEDAAAVVAGVESVFCDTDGVI